MVFRDPVKQNRSKNLGAVKCVVENEVVQLAEMLTGEKLGLMRRVPPDGQNRLGGGP